MDKEKNKRKYLWIYAVVLFSSAFVVLIITAFSQVRLNDNIEEYKSKLAEHENSINRFNVSLSSAAQEKEALRQRISQLEKENDSLKGITTDGGRPSLLEQRLERSRQSFDNLLKADALYGDRDLLACARALSKVNEEDLGSRSKERYQQLKDKVFLYATKELYRRGKEYYSEKEYLKAREHFEESISYDNTQYYEENSLYFLVRISNNLKEHEKMKEYADTLEKKFPNSEYIEMIADLSKQEY